VRITGTGRQRGDLRQSIDDSRKLCAALEPRTRPRRVEVAIVGERPGSVEQCSPRVCAVATAPPSSERASQALSPRTELTLEPQVERLCEEGIGRLTRRDLEERIDTRLDGPLAQDVRAERVNRAYLRHF